MTGSEHRGGRCGPHAGWCGLHALDQGEGAVRVYTNSVARSSSRDKTEICGRSRTRTIRRGRSWESRVLEWTKISDSPETRGKWLNLGFAGLHGTKRYRTQKIFG